jgi:ketosteroid isomerase-like protein
LIIGTAISAFAQCSDADKKALEAFDRAWGTAGETGDKAALMNVYADDYTGLPAMLGKAATIENTMKTAERNKANPALADKVTHDVYMISCTPNTATITHRNIISTPDGTGGKPETFWTRSVHFLEKRGGKWQVVSNAGHDMNDYMILGYMEQDWNNAALKHDKAWFDSNYATDYSSISSGSATLMNKEEDIADTMKGAGGESWNELSDLNIRVDGNMAIVTGINHVKGKDDKGVAYDRKIRFTDTWIKRDGRWQAWATQGTRLPTVAETAMK